MHGYYGEAPVNLGPLALPDWHEFMHTLYMPVRIPARDDTRHVPVCEVHSPQTGTQYAVPERLGFLGAHLWTVVGDAAEAAPHLADPYVYVTARRGYATPGNPLNRPGWHCDDFGGTDLNYIWTDTYPTQVLRSDLPLAIPSGDAESMQAMSWVAAQVKYRYTHDRKPDYVDRQIDKANARIEEMPVGHLMRLSPYVIHDTPAIPEPGGMRSFFKISVSTHRYNLLGNSHNHLLDYDWPMHDRATVRNQPGGNSDYIKDAT